MDNIFAIRPQDTSSDAGVQAFLFQRMLMSNAFITLAVVTEADDSGEQVSVKPMVEGFTGAGERIPKTEIYGVPVWRLQRGASAVIMPPVVGDIGMIAICDRDISGVKATKDSSLPGSSRTHNYADALYLGGVLNAEPTQYVKFRDDGIDIVSPLSVTMTAPVVEINSDTSLTFNSANIVMNGPVSQGAGSYAGDFEFQGNITALGEVTGKGVKLSDHIHTGVQTGSGNTGKPQ
ncbi:Gp138 family membrane-puncturing spike protein [Pantoea sp. EABMAA-21]|uniref:Gp138 family membrane-puncturing spike protein n=1 Tax=Pantoea sp. EABMAA-21 TaxID=3043302 RepID=UPI0024B61028|nr:Gp138 family membrane-puncturing spike protein [Pantoea sp. EABMAA-21]MDI9276160.1 Gp138 family membrane-puncturing spike protein [Pantoea sp. EABMAA-21]